MQIRHKQPQLYLQALAEMRERIVNNPDSGSPWLGQRVWRTKSDVDDYTIAVYLRGAWAFHMLRNFFMDLDTMKEDAFVDMMRDFYTTYHGRAASTANFMNVVEKHAGQPMGWFFQQWVKDTAVPTYRFSWESAKTSEGMYRVTLHVRQRGVPAEFRMAVPVLVVLADGAHARTRIWVDKPDVSVELPLMPLPPRIIKFNDLSSVLCTVEE